MHTASRMVEVRALDLQMNALGLRTDAPAHSMMNHCPCSHADRGLGYLERGGPAQKTTLETSHCADLDREQQKALKGNYRGKSQLEADQGATGDSEECVFQ